MITTFVILGLTILLFIHGKLRSDLVALISLLALFLAEVLTAEQTLAGFSDSTVILIAALFIVGEGLSRTGVTAWMGNQVLQLAGKSKVRLLVVLILGTAVLSAFISNTGTVATLLPAVVAAAWRIGSVPSKFLMPLAFAANSGGLLTLTGTPPNIVVADALAGAGYRPFGYFEYAYIGIPLLLCTVTYMSLIGRKLLPSRNADQRPVDLTQSIGEFATTFGLKEDLFYLRVRLASKLVGQTLAEAALGRDYNVSVLRVDRRQGAEENEPAANGRFTRIREQLEQLQPDPEQTPVPGAGTTIHSQDRLLVKGSREDVRRLAIDTNLGMQVVEEDSDALSHELLSTEIGIAEVLLTLRSQYIGRSLADVRFADKFRVQVLGIWRGDKAIMGANVHLKFGDMLLVRGRWDDIDLLRNESRNFVVVGSPEALSRQVVELSPRSLFAILVLVGMVTMMVTGVVPTVIAALIAAVAMVLGGCLSMGQVYRSIGWQSVVLIAAMIPMSTALRVTGGAELMASGLVASLGTISPLALLAGIFVLTAAFSQVINNTATSVLVAPIVLQASLEMGVSPHPLLMAVAVSASTAFLTPIGTTTNLMVLTAGGYKFTDYMKVGGPLMLLFLLISILLIPLIWPF
ncbi:MAG: SLC13 family permease [Chloroflexota bacterium]